MVDGSIIISTKIDQKGFNSGVGQIQKGAEKLKKSLAGLASAIGVAFGAAAIINFGKSTVQAATTATNALEGLKSIIEGQGRSFSDAQKFINEYISDGLVPLADATTAYKNLAARGYDDGQIQSVMTALKNSATFGRQASLTMGEAVKSASEGLKNENSILVDNAGVTKNVSVMWKDYAKSIGVGVDSLTQAQKVQAEVNGILQETRFQTGDAAKIANTYSGQVARLTADFQNLKIAFGNAIIPVAKAILPWLNAIVDRLTTFANRLGFVTQNIFGVTTAADSLNESASSAYELSSAIQDVGDSAKKASKSMASFDTLNVLKSSDEETESSEPQLKDVSPLNNIPKVDSSENSISAEIEKALDGVTLIVSGALLALGALLAFSGVNVLLGISLMAVGAIGLATEMAINWDTITEVLRGPVGVVTEIISGAVLMLGALLAFSGVNIMLGIALMAVGAAGLATVAAVNWNSMKEALQGPVGDLTTFISGSLLAIGLILAMSGINMTLGIALMGAGAAGLVTVAAANWNSMKESLQGPMGAVAALAGSALLVLGIVLLFSGVGIPLGLGLILLGAASLGTAIAANWNSIPNKLKGVWDGITNGFKHFANGIVGGIEWLINKVIGGVNWIIKQLNKISFDIPDWVPGIGGGKFGFNFSYLNSVSLPRLAKGAVIPPNREFMAVLGDQKRGTNIEAPLDTIVNGMMIALAKNGNQGTGDININFTGNLAQLARILNPVIEKEQHRSSVFTPQPTR